MICGWFFILPTLVLLAKADGTSSSAEAAAINAGAANGIMIPNMLNPGAVNGMAVNGQAQPGQMGMSVPQLVPVIQPVLISQPGLPIGQAGMPLVPGMGLQQALAFPVPQPQLQPANGVAPLFAILSQGGLQVPVLNPGQAIQILPLGAGNNIMQPVMGAQGAGNAALKVKRSAPTDSAPTARPADPETFPAPETRPSLAKILMLLTQLPERQLNNPEMNQPPEEQNEKTSGEEYSGSGAYLGDEVLTNI